jgi:hypothetical protein
MISILPCHEVTCQDKNLRRLDRGNGDMVSQVGEDQYSVDG